MKVIVIGGGPAGILASISASLCGDEVTILEKMPTIGKKLLITGKGRCNITSSIDIQDFIKNIPGNGMFLYSAFNIFNNKDIIKLLENNGLKVKEERGNRIFPITDRSVDVLDTFKRILKKCKVKIINNAEVKEIVVKNKKITGAVYKKEGNTYTINAEKIILATGGKSYPGTGSTGDGYKIVEKLGHTVKPIKPSLVPLESKGEALKVCQELQGLSLKNVAIKIMDTQTNKEIYEDFGEMLFTHFGVSGPIILSGSAHLIRYKNIEELLKNNYIKIYIDLKPALSEKKLDERILRDFSEEKNKALKNSLNKLLPQKMIETVILKSEIDENKKVNEITRVERLKLVNILKKFEVTINGFRPVEEAIVTSGGINIKEINPKTMESKIIEGLFFAGEIIDVDAYTGGFNLQIAYSTGYTAGLNKD